MDDESAPEACVRCHSKVNFSAKSISVSRNFFFLVICDAQFSVKSISRIFLYQQVFEVEKIATKAGQMHKHCLSCNECKRDLDASTFYNGFDGEVYCKYCYAVKFGHKQKSSYNPSSIQDVKTIQGEKGDRSTCPRCFGKVFFYFYFLVKCYDNLSLLCQVFEAERMVTRVGNFHRNCFSCIECNKKLDSTTCCEGKIDDNRKDIFLFVLFKYIGYFFIYLKIGPDAEVYCQSCYSFEFGTKARTKPKKGFKKYVNIILLSFFERPVYF